MKLNMHDELNSMELSQKMLEIRAIAFSTMNPSISMKRKYSSASHHYRPHLTSASSNEEHVNCEDEDEDSRASSTLVGNGDLVKANAKAIANDINLPSPPSSTRSSFDNDGITRDSFMLSNGDISENNDDSHVSTFGSFSLSNESNEISENEPTTESSQISHDVVDDDVKFIAEYLVKTVSEEIEESSNSLEAGEENEEDEELWKDVEIDFEGETILPNGVRLYLGIADLPFYQEDDNEHSPTFTNQLNFIKTILTKYLLRYKTAVPFLHPVDSLKFRIPHYYKIIRQPMDLTTIKNRINFLWYRSAAECIADLRLIFKNCYSFNSPTDFVYNSGKKLEEYLEEKLKDMPPTEVEVPCPPRPSVEEYNKIVEKRNAKKRTYSIAESVESVESCSGISYTPIKMTTRSERGVMVRKPSKDLPTPISTPQTKAPSVKRVPLNQAMKFCLDFIKSLFTKKHAEYAWPFWKPVSIEEYPDYLQKIKRPIDLSTIKINIETGKYITVNDFTNDMRLMFSNCIRYNTYESPVIEQARKLREVFEYEFARIPDLYLSQKLTIQSPSISNSRTSSPQARITSASVSSSSNHNIIISTSSSSKHHSSSSDNHHHHHQKHKKSKTSDSKKPSPKVRTSSDNSGHLILDSLSRLNGTSSVDSTDMSSESRMMLLEQQVASLRNALTSVLTSGSDALIKGLTGKQTPVPKVNGTTNKRGPRASTAKKNGYQPKAKTTTPKKAVNPRKRKHHLSSDEDSDSDVEANHLSDLVDPFDPVNIEDLKKLKDDLENLRAKDLQNVLRILQSTEPSLRCDDESNVEIDFEALKPKTLVALRKYVTSCMLNAKSSPSINHQSTAAPSTAGSISNNKKFCHSSSSAAPSNSFRGGNSNLVTDCDNLSNHNWSRAGSRASNLQLSESSSSSDSELDD